MMIRYVEPGGGATVVLPYSEVCMHMRVAGKKMRCTLISPDGRYPMVQLLDDDEHPFSFPITLAEAGFSQDGQGRIYTSN